MVYSSSAGSGKTYTIVREYIRLALTAPDYFRHILAITFTNKAANEMKERVLSTLLQISDPENYADKPAVTHLIPELCEITGLSPEKVSQKASDVIKTILHRYDDFSIRTIDSFVTRIIRTFAHDLKLPQDFEIEMDAETLIRDAVGRIMDKIGVDEELTNILIEFTLSKTDEERSWNIEKDLAHIAGHLFEEAAFPYLERLTGIKPSAFLKTRANIRRYCGDLTEKLAQSASGALELLGKSNIPPEAFFKGPSGIGNYLLKLNAGNVEPPKKTVQDTLASKRWFSKENEPIFSSSFSAIENEFLAHCNQITSLLDAEYKNFVLFGLVEKSLYQLGVLHAIQVELDAIRQENSILHISEFNRRITEIINREPVPFIYERTGEKHHHYMVDEFQDTSGLQWKNLLPLISNSLANGYANRIVGDGKQAIYRFRNGQVQQFLSLPFLPPHFDRSVFGEAEKALERNFEKSVLGTNFRSLKNIILFNNSFYTHIADNLDESLLKVYENIRQEWQPGKTGGFISIKFFDPASDQDFEEWNLLHVLNTIRDLTLDKGYALSDIAILTNTNKKGNRLAAGIAEEGIHVISAEALLLSASPFINLLSSALRLLDHAEDNVARASLIRHLFTIDTNQDQYLLPGILKEVGNDSFYSQLNVLGYPFNPALLKTLPVYDLCEELVRVFRLSDNGYNVYVQFFLEFALKTSASGAVRIPDFLEAWDEAAEKLSVIVPEGIDAARVMTIHKAKGLEFPVVIWPYATEAVRNTIKTIWVETDHNVLKELPVAILPVSESLVKAGFEERYREERNLSMLDLINLMYVVTTRAIGRLYILTTLPKEKSAKTEGNSSLNVASLLDGYLQAHPDGWNRLENEYTFGDASTIHSGSRKTAGEEVTSGSKFISTDWKSRIWVASRTPWDWEVDTPSQKQDWGTLVHDLFSGITTPETSNAVIGKFRDRKLIHSDDLTRIEGMVSNVVRHELLSAFFSDTDEVKSEAAILLPDGQLYRPDRILCKGNTAKVLDFKTGHPKDWHKDQIVSYKSVLTEMGYSVTAAYLVYLNETLSILEV